MSPSQSHPDTRDVMSHVELRTQHETRTQDLLNDVPDSISLRRLSLESAVPTPFAHRKVSLEASREWIRPKMSHSWTPSELSGSSCALEMVLP